jgi:3-phenylpropionate/cinnamic acid dioxygenase small subunit
MDPGLILEVQQFLHREAHLLDQRRFDEWLALFTTDVRYWMPVVTTPDASRPAVARDDDLAWFDDDHASLTLRVRRLRGELAHAEHPPSRTRRLIGTILVEPSPIADELCVQSNFLVYRTRRERDLDLFVGTREDTLRRVDGAWRIARRKLVLDQDILASPNLSIFF